MNNPINDLIIRIKNAYMSRLEHVTAPYSSFKEAVVKKLVTEGYLAGYEVVGEGAVKKLVCTLKYDGAVPALADVKLYSRPGRRWYAPVSELKTVKSGFGIALISTSKGLLTNKEARMQQVGGELLFEVW